MDMKVQGGVTLHNVQANKGVSMGRGDIQPDIAVHMQSFDHKDYNYEDAIMDLEAIKRFLYMLAGIPYSAKQNSEASGKTNHWA